jgi:EAL domain-containing protein (putative c-di-GMP-specific phosphodiesterase class I)
VLFERHAAVTGAIDAKAEIEELDRLLVLAALGRELHMRITVERVETAQQVAFLDGVNADQVRKQGY